MTDAAVKAALPELFVLALTILGEARGDAIEGKVFVGSVVRNRVETPNRFGGDRYDKVCLKRAQFACWWKDGGAETYDDVMTRARAFCVADAARPAARFDAVMKECLFVAEGIMSHHLQDRAHGATHYVTRAVWQRHPPAWATGTPIVEVGTQVGFRA